MTQQRVLFAAPAAYTLSGLAVWLDYLLPGLSGQGWDAVLGLVSGRLHASAAYLDEHPYDRTVLVRNPTGSREGRVRAFEKAIREIDPDVVVSVNIPDALYAVERLRSRGGGYRRAVLAVHGFVPAIFGDAREMSDSLDGLICVNRLGCVLARELAGLSGTRVFYAAGGVEIPQTMPALAPIGGRLRVGFVGRLDQQQKRVLDLIEIARELSRRGIDFELLLVGAGPEETLLKSRADEAGLADHITFVGLKSYEALFSDVYPMIDVLLITSHWETGPLVAWEALAWGISVVSSRYIGSGYEAALIHGETAMLFPTGDTMAAADCIVALVDGDLRKRLRETGRALVENRYSHQASVEAWHRTLTGVLESPPRPPRSSRRRIPVAGRLDRWLGTPLAESLRRLAGIRFDHSDPGGEWPHAYGTSGISEKAFWEAAKQHDCVA